MNYNAIVLAITKAASAAKVSSALLLAICSYESADFTVTYNHIDGGSPSYGICQIKEDTARMLGFKGKASELMNTHTNAKWAARYLKYQEDRYGTNDWCKLAAAYNAGSYNESKKVPGKPRNLKYVRRVQRKLAEELQDRLSCEDNAFAEAK